MEMVKMNKIKVLALTLALTLAVQLALAEEKPGVIEAASQELQPQAQTQANLNSSGVDLKYIDPLKYTLGPEDVVEITVMRHPEFSGIYPVNLEGKLQYKFVGDIDVTGLTKKELEDKIKGVISAFVISPEVNVTVVEYKSKVIYVLGEVAQPGKYYMRSETIPIREAIVQAGLPLQSAAMRKCRIITPDKNGKVKTRNVNLYEVLYGGNLRLNLEMHPGDVLYVPCTVMAKLIRVINPVTSTVAGAATGPEGAATVKTSATTLAR